MSNSSPSASGPAPAPAPVAEPPFAVFTDSDDDVFGPLGLSALCHVCGASTMWSTTLSWQTALCSDASCSPDRVYRVSGARASEESGGSPIATPAGGLTPTSQRSLEQNFIGT
ncbi:hypothetical protein DTO166G4_5300 [Paecilomyces variotii]|nr:hypothetical protein DTO166G4_5300 [Paecilomyces variotii]KAJ9234533.1 hypothetical protein DTO166G5_5130 [Paecilomyces variotii]KAJ9265002.1 hypothetical protein DTO195F2_2014 [Paecilomyces variotii]KAJ9305624.1 hypothetical protein DTO217A2_4853 [Paecilomyces variotii]KAJ9370010.1 hypothetical protein DTO282E5_5350 [Paecilomyces variotii]